MSQTQPVPERPLSFETSVKIEATRPRQTQPPASPFREVLAGGVSVLMGGAQVATHVMGAPALAAAVQTARAGAVAAVAGAGAAPAVVGGTAAALGSGGAAAAGGVVAGGDGTDLATMQAMQRESQAFNLQLLALQEDVQQENRRFTTLSNVLRAKHDTAKAAVSNIRG
jgi:hypothetical protein